jgi:hypothetical protein
MLNHGCKVPQDCRYCKLLCSEKILPKKPKKGCYADKRLTRNDALELGLCWCCPSETGCTAI